MMQYRAFRNTDPPALAEIWRSQPPIRGRYPVMSSNDFEQLVLSRPFFDRHGLIVAVEDQQPVGFVHAALGPRPDLAGLGSKQGVICALMVAHQKNLETIGAELIREAEQYLQQQGARSIQSGSCPPLAPYYQGLYGGSHVPGWLETDQATRDLFAGQGYQHTRTRIVLQRSLVGFRPTVNRDQMQIRRSYQVETDDDPLADNWWEACTTAFANQTRFHLVARQGAGGGRGYAARSTGSYPMSSGSPPTGHGQVTFWDIEPLASSWGVHAAGLTQFEIDEDRRRQGLATFLLGESLRHLQTQGTTVVETQIDETDEASAALFRKTGFTPIERGYVYHKSLA